MSDVSSSNQQLAAILRTLARGYHVDSGAIEALTVAAGIVERASGETRAGGYCRRCATQHRRMFCPDCGLKLIPVDVNTPKASEPLPAPVEDTRPTRFTCGTCEKAIKSTTFWCNDICCPFKKGADRV